MEGAGEASTVCPGGAPGGRTRGGALGRRHEGSSKIGPNTSRTQTLSVSIMPCSVHPAAAIASGPPQFSQSRGFTAAREREGRSSPLVRSPPAGEGDADARGERGGERGAGRGGAGRPRRPGAGEIQENPVRLRCRGRAPGGPPVGAGPGVPLGLEDMRVGCKERAPGGPPVGAGPRVPLGRSDVRVCGVSCY